MSVEECLERGLLQKVQRNIPACEKILGSAGIMLTRSRDLLKAGFYDASVIFAYSAGFQAIKAYLLYRGVREKSHGYAIEYVKEKTDIPADLIGVLDAFRKTRHDIMYGFSQGSMDLNDAELIISVSGKIIDWLN